MRRQGSFKYLDIKLGKSAGFKRYISRKDVHSFARLTGDFNPLHLDGSFAKNSMFKGAIIHGMLAASLISRLIGMHLPGRYAIIINQELKYVNPIKPDSTLRVRGRVINKIDSVKVLVIKTSIYRGDGKVALEGITSVKMMR